MPASVAPSSARKWVAAILAIAGAVVLHLVAQVGMLVTRPDWSISSFRSYFSSDQLSYMGIVSTAATGQFAAVEPFTETGSIFYPRSYYLFLGAVAKVFGVEATVAWNVIGLAVQVVLVIAIAATCILMSGKAWTGLLAAAPFVLGTMSSVTNAAWSTELSSHAVLWGPFAVLFTLNAEAAGLCIGAIALLLLLLAYTRVPSRRARITLTAVSALMIGGLANLQTYSFLTTVYLATFVAAAWAVTTASRRWPALLSLALVPLLFILGPVVSERGSPLITLLFGMLPAVPGVVLLLTRSWTTAVYFVLAGAAAAPTMLGTFAGLMGGDPFLVYRVASTKDLGVDWPVGLIASLAVTLPLALILVAGIHRRRSLWIAYPLGIGLAWTLLATNDLWGANQEPYRFWIGSFTLASITMLPMLIMVAQDYLSQRAVMSPGAPLGGAEPESVLALRPVSVRTVTQQQRLAVVALGLVVLLGLISALDWVRFVRDDRYHWMISFSQPRDTAIADAVAPASAGLVLGDPCVDPKYLKIITRKPVVYMNQGMAWPEQYEAVQRLLEARADGRFDAAAARDASAPWIVTDSACDVDWVELYPDALTEERSAVYETATGPERITLWRVDTDAALEG